MHACRDKAYADNAIGLISRGHIFETPAYREFHQVVHSARFVGGGGGWGVDGGGLTPSVPLDLPRFSLTPHWFNQKYIQNKLLTPSGSIDHSPTCTYAGDKQFGSLSDMLSPDIQALADARSQMPCRCSSAPTPTQMSCRCSSAPTPTLIIFLGQRFRFYRVFTF